MAVGITEQDVWSAADALLLEGARPTIERIRQKLGRGSPNTVSGHVDSWFKHLGGRIKDPRAFTAPPDVPDPVQQAARHFWEVAQAESRRDVDQRVRDGLAAAAQSVQAADERARIAEAAAFEASARLTRSQADVAELRSEMDQLRRAASATDARLQEARSLNEELRARLHQAEATVAAVRETARQDVATAQDRAAAVERRVMLDLDAERTARAKADKRAEAIEGRLQAVTAEAQVIQTKQTEQLAKLQAENGQLALAVASAQAESGDLRKNLATLTSELEEIRSQARAVKSQVELAERVIAAVNARPTRSSTAQRASKRSSTSE